MAVSISFFLRSLSASKYIRRLQPFGLVEIVAIYFRVLPSLFITGVFAGCLLSCLSFGLLLKSSLILDDDFAEKSVSAFSIGFPSKSSSITFPFRMSTNTASTLFSVSEVKNLTNCFAFILGFFGGFLS